MTAKPPTDWEAIEREYRAGQISVREIARQHGVSDGAIRKRAKERGWPRDLSEQVRQAVRSELVRTEVRTSNAREAVELAAARGVEVVLSHRRRLSRLGDLADQLTARAEAALSVPDLLPLDALTDAAQTVESVGRTIDRLIKGERQAFGLDEQQVEMDESLSARIDRAKRRLTDNG